jgi:membrane-associated phospholipid phosphatase
VNTTDFIRADTAATLILGGLGLLVAAIGALGWWVAAHPAKVKALTRSLREHPWVMCAERRYRAEIEFVARRLRPEAALGLSCTIGLAALAVSAWVFGAVLQTALAPEKVALFDSPIVSYVAGHRLSWVTAGMEGISDLGKEIFLVVLIGAGGLALRFRTGSWHPLLLLTVALLGAMLLEKPVKLVIARPRPPVVWMAVPTKGFAFPSGHTIQSTAAYGALAYLIARIQRDWRAKVRSLTLGALIPFLVGVSRIYLGVHWPTDVMAGWALGSAWLAVVFTTSSIIEHAGALAPPTDGG